MALANFFEAGLASLGAVCERTWHNRLQVLAEGHAAKLWNDDGALVDSEILFHGPDQSGVDNAAAEAFPGCPLTFRLAETICGSGRTLDRIVLRPFEPTPRPPSTETAERLWHAQFSGCARWRLESVPVTAWHFSLLVLARCEIQAIDQHWSLHRIALSLPDGQSDDALAASLPLADADFQPPALDWPKPDMAQWRQHLHSALRHDLDHDLAGILRRQENYLRREFDRIHNYFDSYEGELSDRQRHSNSATVKTKMADRLAAAQSERARRCQDQLHRHEIRVVPHVDALCLLAEPAWQATVSFFRQGCSYSGRALYIPRSRSWKQSCCENRLILPR